jgi:hypothetical protein
MTNTSLRSVSSAARTAVLLAAVSFVLCVAPARAQGVGPNVALPATRPRTNLQIMGGGMQVPWQVSLHPATNYVAIGQCLPMYIDLLDASGKDIPRSPNGQRVTIADFDWTASGNAAVGQYDGPNAWAVCACPAAAVGSTIHVMATYPAASLAENKKVPGLAFQSFIELPVTPAHGTNSPAGCDNVLVTTTVAIAVPRGGAPPTVVSTGHNSLQNPPASTGTPPTGTPTSVTPASGTPTTVAPPAAVSAPPSAVARAGVPVVGEPIAVAPTQGHAPSQAAIVPVNPKRFSAVQTGPGAVTLAWDPVAGVAFYQVWGAGLPNTGVTVSSGTVTTVSGVPAGLQMWSVGSYYTPGPVSTPAIDFTKAQLQVTSSIATSGHYRVVANGFRVIHPTLDGSLSMDGKGDEVYGAFTMFHYNRKSGAMLDRDLRRTHVIGDVNNISGREKGGTFSAAGGLQAGDVFPVATSWSDQAVAPPTNYTFPFLIWQGTLTNAEDAVIILPTLWEYDGNSQYYDQWFVTELANAPAIWSNLAVQEALGGARLGLVIPSGTSAPLTGSAFSTGIAFNMPLMLPGMPSILGGSFDRPIGISLPNGQARLPRRAIVITREVIETSLHKAVSGAGTAVDSMMTSLEKAAAAYAAMQQSIVDLSAPGGASASQSSSTTIGDAGTGGVLAIPLFDESSPALQGQYVLYIQVDRIP